ncbi:MAG: alpha/beta fold hydrolase [Variibacter sp.]|nr:alpha/beta fold hydrolase [Variibacter sp.]
MTTPLPVVLVPGLNCSARLYADQIPVLWQFGPVMIAEHREDDSVPAIAGRILSHAPPRFAVAGLSMGGYMVLEMLRQAPERIAKAALLDTAARADTPEQSARRDALIALARTGRFPEVTESLWPILVHEDRLGDAELKRAVVRMADENGAEAFIRQQIALKGRADYRASLGAVRCPVLVLVGEGDRLTPPKLAQEIAAGIPAARLVSVPGCGHLSTMEKPEAVNAALVEWMQA